MIWLIQDFDLLSVLLRALTLSFEALTIGGVFFLLLIARPSAAEDAARRAAVRLCAWASFALAVAQTLSTFETIMVLMSGSGLSFHDVVTASFFLSGAAIPVAALLLFLLLRNGVIRYSGPLLTLIVLAGSVALSHAASRLDHRLVLVILTAAHHLGTAAWIGAMPFLLVTLRGSQQGQGLHALVRRFSNMTLVSVAVLVVAGIGMAYFYVGSWNGLYGTSYGLMLTTKIYLFLLMVTLGAGNFFLLRRTRGDAQPVLMRLRRFSEAEIGLGFTVILVAASLTSQPPAADMQHDTPSAHEIAQRMAWKLPSMTTPRFAQLSKRASLQDSLESSSYSGGSANDAMDQVWSEYNHHWAGVIVFAAGLFALCANFGRRRGKTSNWFGNWPLLFIGLAIFIALRADPDAWPLGPRALWGSFAEPEVLEHRIFAVLITAFAVFEWAVETDRVANMRAAMVFPALCALGGALLMTHSHSLGVPKEETLAELSHTLIALGGATAGWSRWLQLRLPESPGSDQDGKIKSALNWVWPVCLMLVGLVLLNYRES